MKYKPLLLAFMLLLPMGLIAAISPAKATFGTPTLYVLPRDTKFYGPCIKSTMFKIDVYLWSGLATGYDVYAFDFTLDWSMIQTISLVNATYHSPWNNTFPIANQTSTSINPITGKSWISDYHLALTAISPSTGLFDVNASVLTLWFHVDMDLCWPQQLLGFFTFSNVSMSSDGTAVVPIPNPETDIGTYEQYSVRPNMDLTTTDVAYNATTNTITEKCVSHTFDIEVDLTNVTNVYGFGFLMNYNPAYLETDVQKITSKPTFAGPYEYTAVYVGPAASTPYGPLVAGQILVVFVRPSEKPGVCGANLPSVDIIFHTIWTANTTLTQLPTPFTSTIGLTWGFVLVKCDQNQQYLGNLSTPGEPLNQLGTPFTISGPGEYNSYGGQGYYGGAIGYAPNWFITNGGEGWGLAAGQFAPISSPPGPGGLLLGAAIKYYFKPSKYDLNLDCVVDVQDLKVLLPYYSTTIAEIRPLLNYGDLYDDPAHPGLVDIFDFVAIAKNEGPVDP